MLTPAHPVACGTCFARVRGLTRGVYGPRHVVVRRAVTDRRLVEGCGC